MPKARCHRITSQALKRTLPPFLLLIPTDSIERSRRRNMWL